MLLFLHPIVNKTENTHKYFQVEKEIFRRRKLGNSCTYSMENPFRFDGSLNVCCSFTFCFIYCTKH